MTDRDRDMDRIRKCLALSASANPHEAAAALRQARKLMDKLGVTQEDAAVRTDVRKGPATQRPAQWEAILLSVVGEAFGVAPVRNWDRKFMEATGRVGFIGMADAAEVAGYAWDVLRRLCERSRSRHYAELRRCRRATRIRRADVYASHWADQVGAEVRKFARDFGPRPEPVRRALAAIRTEVGVVRRPSSDMRDWRSAVAGRIDGKKARLLGAARHERRQAIASS